MANDSPTPPSNPALYLNHSCETVVPDAYLLKGGIPTSPFGSGEPYPPFVGLKGGLSKVEALG